MEPRQTRSKTVTVMHVVRAIKLFIFSITDRAWLVFAGVVAPFVGVGDAVGVELVAVALLELTITECGSALGTAALDDSEVGCGDGGDGDGGDGDGWRMVCDGATTVEDVLEDDGEVAVIFVIENAGLVLPELPKTWWNSELVIIFKGAKSLVKQNLRTMI